MKNRRKTVVVLIILLLASVSYLGFRSLGIQPNNESTDGRSLENKGDTGSVRKQQVCSLTIQCKTTLAYLDKISENKKKVIPKDGIILRLDNAAFQSGDTLYGFLVRECKKASVLIDIDTSFSGYIKGIGNLYEKDFGKSSGWLYMINGGYPSTGIKEYKLKNGDEIELIYTCKEGDVTSG